LTTRRGGHGTVDAQPIASEAAQVPPDALVQKSSNLIEATLRMAPDVFCPNRTRCKRMRNADPIEKGRTALIATTRNFGRRQIQGMRELFSAQRRV